VVGETQFQSASHGSIETRQKNASHDSNETLRWLAKKYIKPRTPFFKNGVLLFYPNSGSVGMVLILHKTIDLKKERTLTIQCCVMFCGVLYGSFF